MLRKSIAHAAAVLIFTYLTIVALHACPISLQIENRSTSVILAVRFRHHGTEAWEQTSLPLDPNNKTAIHWSTAADSDNYDIEVVYANAPSLPQSQNVCDLCTTSQITILNDRVNIKGNCSAGE